MVQPAELLVLSAVRGGEESFAQTILDSLSPNRSGDWSIEAESHPVFIWVTPNSIEMPRQGWKLHLAATPQSARECLEKVLPVLIARRANFKVVKSLEALQQLDDSVPQVGKFITVYPQDDNQAIELAQMLHHATRGSRGPSIRTDRALCRGSIVHYRYGSFKERYMQDSEGQEVAALEDASGRLVPDRRLGCYTPPSWVTDPFVGAGLVPAWDERPLFAKRFVAASLLQQGFQNDVFMGIDLETNSLCVIKRSRDDGYTERLGGLSSLRLKREGSILRRMSSHGGFPQVIELLEIEGDALLVLEWMPSVSLDVHIRQLLAELRPPSLKTAVLYMVELSTLVASLHDEGFVHRDIKPSNILVDDSGSLHITDFDSAAELANTDDTWHGARGTQGWAPPEQFSGSPVALTDDIFGLGATFFYICTGVAANAEPEALLEQQRAESIFRSIRPDLPAELLDIILRCLEKDPARRFQSASEILAAIAAVQRHSSIPMLGPRKVQACPPHLEIESASRELYERLQQEIEGVASGVRDPGLFWGGERVSLDLASGFSGIVLALARITRSFSPDVKPLLRRAADLLCTLQQQRSDFSHTGLFAGKAGCGLALAHASQMVTQSGDFLQQAEKIAAQLATLPVLSVNVCHGLAGQIFFYLALFKITSKTQYLCLAEDCGRQILSKAEHAGPGIAWRSKGSTDAKDNLYLGYAYGTAGIADALLSLHAVTHHAVFREAALQAALWLAANSLRSHDDDVVVWPNAPGDKPVGASWCEGSTGIGLFFLHAAQQRLLPVAEALAIRSARACASAPWLGPSLSYGLSGNIDFLLEMYRHFREPWLLSSAGALCASLLRLRDNHFSDLVRRRGESRVGAPAYLVGYAGVLPVLLRVLDPTLPSTVPGPAMIDLPQ